MERREKNLLRVLFAAMALVVFVGVFIPMMEVDAAQYASISKQMWQEKSFLEIHHRDLNYLDKPPLLFWLSSLSMGLLGFSNFAYKLPSILISVLGVWSTYKLARLYYNELTAWWSALMYSTSVAFFIFNNDIRTDTLLINLLVFSVWQLSEYRKTLKWRPFLLAFTGIGLGMLAKGPLGLVFPAMALGGDILLSRDWKFLFRPHWLLGLFIVALILLPMCIGLYRQFDANPDAWVNGERGVSGLRFYFWTQSFGRITGESVWATSSSNNPGTFYLTGTFLWAFLPWTPLFVYGFFRGCLRLIRQRFKSLPGQEWISFSAFLLPLIALSKSGYQLNHYIYLVVPFTSIVAAKVLNDLRESRGRWIKVWQTYALVFLFAVLAVLVWILLQVFPTHWAWVILLALPLVILIIRQLNGKVSLTLAATIIFCFGVLNLHFYPRLLKYQRGRYVSRNYNEIRQKDSRLYYFRMEVSHALDFYQDRWVPNFGYELSEELLNTPNLFLYTNEEGIQILDTAGIRYNVIERMEYYPVTQLSIGFLNPESRPRYIRYRYLIELLN